MHVELFSCLLGKLQAVERGLQEWKIVNNWQFLTWVEFRYAPLQLQTYQPSQDVTWTDEEFLETMEHHLNELKATLLAGLPCHVPGKCGGSRLQACPKGKHELKEL
jgi:hypothetical protein